MSETLFQQDTYAVVEVLGHNTFAGTISEHVLGGSAFIRVDVPGISQEIRRETNWRGETVEKTIPGMLGFTKLIGAGSIYAITPCSEEGAKKVARERRALPVAIADFSPEITTKMIAAAPHADDEDDETEEMEEDEVAF